MKRDLAKLASLSPFELKDELIKTASSHHEKHMLNAGRGNPNFLSTIPRHAFFQFGIFAMSEAERSFIYMPEGVGGFPQKDGIEGRFDIFTTSAERCSTPGISFIRAAVSYVRDHLGIPAEDFIYEMCAAILGCNYPVPDRMLSISEVIVGEYIRKEMIGSTVFNNDFDLFAVEGGTAAMTYIFNSMRENRLLKPGDKIALGMPIFTPYIEIPQLKDYRLVEVNIDSEPENGWQYTKTELDKLLDPQVKAFFLVNPSNPPSVKMSDENIRHLVGIIKKRPDLIILTDDVYGTFADNFSSLFAHCPKNTMLVYSYSKYFGATGWRLGVIAINHKNVFDDKLADLPENVKKELDERYESITTAPRKLKFIDRLVADSRTVALNHTAGLATPVQAQMVMFSLFALMDESDAYKNAMKRIVHRRKEALYRYIGVTPEHDPNNIDYYHLLDMEELSSRMHGEEFTAWMLSRMEPNEALFALAEHAGVVLLPAKGFGTDHPSFRISLANLTETEYMKIGQAVHKLIFAYYAMYKDERNNTGAVKPPAKKNGNGNKKVN